MKRRSVAVIAIPPKCLIPGSVGADAIDAVMARHATTERRNTVYPAAYRTRLLCRSNPTTKHAGDPSGIARPNGKLPGPDNLRATIKAFLQAATAPTLS